MSDKKYVKGRYYWAVPIYDVDTNEDNDWWINRLQPALYMGDDAWLWIGFDEDQEWPARWVGEEIKTPEKYEVFHTTEPQ